MDTYILELLYYNILAWFNLLLAHQSMLFVVEGYVLATPMKRYNLTHDNASTESVCIINDSYITTSAVY
jgi:hypothetical protein